MPRKVIGPSRLSQIMAHLSKAPRPQLAGVKSLKLTLALRNDHFGARHFLKEDMPRIRYANPKVDIAVTKLPKTKEETWKPELVLEFSDGRTQTMSLHDKWSTNIFTELMETAGGPSWARWKAERKAAGLPLVDGSPAPTVFHPAAPDTTKTGAAAVLP
ncbi:hypothetical protein BV25DRAFT_1802657 [Artomyces pyxidatus]|uniref:Uncharacterized protein n=1 Tax=Artomyces pyxidatus TaxID=48021 RepID=A0ACB8T2U2_9AGAM|nr:hypothetical protein BV25DRAFT_1802657 [Artomyces pyxidatus]